MNKGQTFTRSMLIDARLPEEYKKINYKRNREFFGSQLFEELFKLSQPVIIDLSEEYEKENIFISPNPVSPYIIKHTVSARIEKVQHHHATVEVVQYIPRKATFFEKLKWLFSNE